MENINVKQYAPIVEYLENDGYCFYHATFREFEDVEGTGDTVEEAIASAYEILGIEIDYRQENDLMVPPPFVKQLKTAASGRVTLRLPKSLHQQLIEESEEEGVSLNTCIITKLASAKKV